jgi:hypothetical protein
MSNQSEYENTDFQDDFDDDSDEFEETENQIVKPKLSAKLVNV